MNFSVSNWRKIKQNEPMSQEKLVLTDSIDRPQEKKKKITVLARRHIFLTFSVFHPRSFSFVGRTSSSPREFFIKPPINKAICIRFTPTRKNKLKGFLILIVVVGLGSYSQQSDLMISIAAFVLIPSHQ